VSVRIELAAGAVNIPNTADELVTDPGWQAQCDQVRAALHRTTLPHSAGTVRAWGTCAECTTTAYCSAEQWCSKQDVEDLEICCGVCGE
jgi:hypothetical protein